MFYYFSDNSSFSSKSDAIVHAKLIKDNFKFYYYDDIFSKLNWKIEPPFSLEYYYKEQAKKIRDEYDYVILCYSGGYDSTNILETFYYNNIKIDKIVVVGAFSQDIFYGSDTNHNGEIYYNVFSYLKHLNLENITQVCDYSLLMNSPDNFSIHTYEDAWSDKIGSYISPHHWFWHDLEKHVIPKSWENQKIAIIFGKEKTHLRWLYRSSIYNISTKEGKIGFAFDDGVNSYGNPISNESIKRIHFYWDPAFPIIPIKQVHILKKSFEIKQALEPAENVIYNLKYPLRFKSPKSAQKYLSLRDSFLMKKKDSEIFNLYYRGLKHIYKKIGIKGKFHPLFNENCYSKFYEIE